MEYLRVEARKQMRERQIKALTEDELAASVARTPSMVMTPRAAARTAGKKPRIDLSGFNLDGTPKLLSELAA